MKRLFVIATGSAGKIRDFAHILGTDHYEFKTLKDIGFDEDIIEDGNSFAENAIIKYSPREGRILLRVGGGETTAFERPSALTMIGSNLYICNQASYKVRVLNVQTNSIRDYRVFNEKIYKFIQVNGREFVWLKSGLYRLD